jgi:hypothetical protein
VDRASHQFRGRDQRERGKGTSRAAGQPVELCRRGRRTAPRGRWPDMGDEAWPHVKPLLRQALELRGQIARRRWWNL